MKTKIQKQEELKKGRELLTKSRSLLFADFTGISAENLRRLRQATREAGARFLVIKKRLLNILLKEKGIDFDIQQYRRSVGTSFSTVVPEKISGVLVKALKDAGSKKLEEILGGYDLAGKSILTADEIKFLGQLPPREFLLGQLLGVMTAPWRSFLYILKKRSEKSL